MLRFQLIDATMCGLASEIIGNAFKEQADLLGICREQYRNFVAFETSDGVRNRINKGDHVILAYLQQKAVGTVSYKVATDQSDLGYIKRLAVLPDFRGNMYGCDLVHYAEMLLKEYRVTRIELSIVAGFLRLQKYYERLGYVSREKKSSPSLPFEVLFMEKLLAV